MIAGLLLAAGRSSRFGADKLLHQENGHPLAWFAAQPFLGLERTVAVVPEGGHGLRALFTELGIGVVEISGLPALSRSLQAGLEAAAQARGWIVGLADMPCVRPATVHALCDALDRGADIAACRHAGRRGNPVGFSRDMRAALLALDGDRGARDLLEQRASEVCWLDVDDPGILADVDVPGDLARLRPSLSRTA